MKTIVKLVCGLLLAVPLSLPAAPEVQDEISYSQADLDRMLAPIALYPDTVLSHILIASTYPLEVAQAARWSRQHPDLNGEQAVDAVAGKNWDPSVKALVAFPEILARMDDDLEWTEQLGDAFLAQEGEMMDRVQHLRQRAYAAGNLNSLEHVRVIREREVIYIEPALSHIIYLPYYDPWVIYGSWWWPSYPPYCWTYWAGRPVRYYGSGFYWGIGFHVAPVFYFSGFHWRDRHVVVIPAHRHSGSFWTNSAREIERRSDAQQWQHDSRHRRGVEYRSARLNRDYGHSAPDRGHERRDNTRERELVKRENQRRPDTERTERPQQQAPRSGAEREPAREQRSPGNETESSRNSRREPAPEDARGHRSEGASATPHQNNRGENGGRGSRQRRNER